jgi:phosphate butyryltransferase
MLRNLNDIIHAAQASGHRTVSVAAAQDKDVLMAVKAAKDAGLVQPLLVGDKTLIEPLLAEVGLDPATPIFHEPDAASASAKAVSLIREGKAQLLMKGMVNSSDFLRSILDPVNGLRAGKILNHLAVFEIPGDSKLCFHTDGGINIAPSLDEKRDILVSTIKALHRLGIAQPFVAVLTANEQVSPKMPATVDAKALADLALSGQLPEAIVEGPIAIDVALNPEAAHHKGISSKVTGQVDLFLLPNIEAGNILGKSLLFYMKAKQAAVILGATHPVVMTSRAETAEGKFASIALACLLADKGENS